MKAGGRAVLSLSTIADCAAWDGGGVFATDYANVTLQGGSRVTGCHARNCGGAMAVHKDSHVDILEGSVLHDCNATEWGGGMLASLHTHVRMMQSSILECGGGHVTFLLAWDATLLATDSVRVPQIELAHNAPAAHTRSPWCVPCLTLLVSRVCPSLRHAARRASKAALVKGCSYLLAVQPSSWTAASCGARVAVLCRLSPLMSR